MKGNDEEYKIYYTLFSCYNYYGFTALPVLRSETEAVEEPAAVEETAVEKPEVAEEPESTEEPADVEEEPAVEEEVTVEGEPELVWRYNHENSINSMDVDPDGEMLAVGEFKVTYMHILANGDLIDVIVHEHAVEDLEFSRDGSILGAGQGFHGILLTDFR
ncbi:MAG: hypothetical protein U5N58_01740 [Actinomycetota bacterium]|nr:hypothetical protein [Actinomycetota bacterium]